MKKFIAIFSIILSLTFTLNTITTVAESQQYSQGFYSIKDLGLQLNTPYMIKNNDPNVEGLLFIIDSDRRIQEIIRIGPNSSENPLILLKPGYKIIIYNDVKLTFYQK